MIDGNALETWSSELARVLADALLALRNRIGHAEIRAFAIDCYPWHGSIAFSVLTSEEVRDDPLLDAVEEMAAWRYYDFASTPDGGTPGIDALGEVMRREYTSATDAGARAAVTDAFLEACAEAAADSMVSAVLETFVRADNFWTRVAQPDE
ncbi:MAG: hypothetical protein HOW73_40170 [Polyangiaceae bacterium]|nr:hypothetical protein [Polyangiaceae bacterium]